MMSCNNPFPAVVRHSSTHSEPESGVLRRLLRKTGSLARGGRDRTNDLQVGLLPQKGWSRRNLDFVSKVLLPEILKPRQGESRTPDLSHPAASCRIQVTWIGHATFLIQTGGTNILIDPNWAQWHAFVKRVRRPGVALDHLPQIDLVLVTHAHFDHLHLRSLKRVANGQPVLVPKGVGRLVQNKGFGEVVEMSPWDTVRFRDLTITFTPSKHWGARMVHDVHRGFGGYLIANACGRTVYHCGDSAYFDGFVEIGRRAEIQLALLPIGAYQAMSGRSVHMNPEEALDAFIDLQAIQMSPMHYGSFPLGGEPMHEPLQRLHEGAKSRGMHRSIAVLTEGHPEIF